MLDESAVLLIYHLRFTVSSTSVAYWYIIDFTCASVVRAMILFWS
jgi:hypothetical protein